MAEKIGVEAIFGLSDFNKGLSSYEKGLGKADDATGDFATKSAGKFGGLGGAIGKVGQFMGTAIVAGAAVAGAAIIGVGVKGVTAFMDFQASMNEVFTLLPGISQDAMGQMTEQVKQFSKDFGVLPDEVVPALYQALSAGVPQENVFSFLEVANKAAVGGASTLETAVNGISSVVNAYGSDVLSADKASDIMFTTVRLGKTNFQELSDSMFNVGPTAAALGVGFDQVSAALAAMTLQGTPTSVATTQLRSLMVELSKDGSKAAATFEHMSGKSFKDFIAGGGDMSQALGVMEKAADANGMQLSDMFSSVEAGNAALALTGKGAQTFKDDLKAMGESAGATDKAYDQMNTGIQDALDDLKAAWAVALLDIGGALAPALEYLADLAADHLPAVTDALGALFKEIGAVIGYLVALVDVGEDANEFLDNMSPLTRSVVLQIVDLTKEIKATWQWLGYTIGKFVSWKDILIVLGAALATVVVPAIIATMAAVTPMIAVFAGAVAAVAALRTAWENDFGGIRETVTAVFDSIKNAVQPVLDAITNFGSGALAEIVAFATGNETEFTNVKAIWDAAKTAASTLFGDIVGYVTQNLPTWKSNLVEWGTAALSWIADAAGKVTEKLGEWWTALSGYITNHLPAWKVVLGDWAKEAWFWISVAADSVADKLGEWWTNITTYVTNHLPEWKAKLTEWAGAAWGWIVIAAGLVGGKLSEWWTAIRGYVVDHLPEWIEKLKGWATAAWQWIVDTVKLIPAKLGEWWIALKGWLETQLPIWKTQLAEWATALWQWIKDTIPQIPIKLKEWFTELKKWFDDNKPLFEAKLNEWSLILYGWISGDATKTGTAQALDDWKNKTVFQKLKAFDDELTINRLDAQTILYQWITDAIPGTITAVTDWMIAWIKGVDPKAPGGPATELDKAKIRNKEAFDEMMNTIGISLSDGAKKVARAAMEQMGLGFLLEKDGLSLKIKEIKDAILSYFNVAEWYQRGKDILVNLKEGWNAFKSGFTDTVKAVKDAVIGFFNVTEWYQRGKDSLANIRDGWDAIKSTLLTSIGDVVTNAVKKFTDIDWLQLGKDIIQGIVNGIDAMKTSLINKIKEMADLVPQWLKDLWGMASPSKVTMELGRYLVEGLIVGITQTIPSLHKVIGDLGDDMITSAVTGLERSTPRLLKTIKGIADKVIGNFSAVSGLGQSFSSAGGSFAGRIKNQVASNPTLQKYLDAFEKQKDAADFLKEQSELFTLIQQQGGDLKALFGSITIGLGANANDFLTITTNALRVLNERTNAALHVALLGYDKTIDKLRQQRRTAEQIEDQFQTKNLNALEIYRQRIANLDEQIASVENRILTTGTDQFSWLNTLNSYRESAITDLETYLKQTKVLENSLGRIQSTTLERAQKAIALFRTTQIDPLVQAFQQAGANATQRDELQKLLDARITSINSYINSAGQLAAVEKSVTDLMNGSNFDPGIRRDIEQSLNALYDPNRTVADRQNTINSLKTYVEWAQRAFDLFGQISSDDPLVSRIKSEQVEPLLNQLFNINLATADRIKLTDKYRQAVSALLFVEQRQQALENVQNQLDLVEKVRQLATDSNSPSIFSGVFSGFDPSKTLSPDELATVLARYTDYAISLANRKLTEAIRPRVDVGPQLAALRKQRETFEQIQDDFVSVPFSQTEKFRQMLASYDQMIADAEQGAIETGSQSAVDSVTQLSNSRKLVVDQTREFLRQIRDAQQAISQIRTTTDSQGAQAAEAFRTKYIDPLLSVMDSFGSAGTRNLVLSQINSQVAALNTFVTRINQLAIIQRQMADQPSAMESVLGRFYDPATADSDRQAIIRYVNQIRQLGDLQKGFARITGSMADRFRTDILDPLSERINNLGLSETQRQGELQSLQRYIGQFNYLRAIIKDTSAGAAINPLVGRFQTDVMDKLLDQFYDLRTTEAQRLQIIQQYRVEQEKILALQAKQQQLDYLTQQLDLLNQAKQLNEQFDDLVDFDSIKSGITFGVNATLQDMLTLTSRVIDAMIKTTNDRLGIHSPSKVFAQIGEYMMQGLGMGIWNNRQVPIGAMAGATQQVPYSLTTNRSTNVYMGGVSISNGMDDVMFEARVRQIIDAQLN